MSFVKQFLGKNKDYLLYFLFFVITITIILLIYPKAVIHLTINKFHSNAADYFFKYFTHLGDGLVLVLTTIILLFFSFRHAILIGLSYSLSGLLVQFFKRVIFHDVARPVKYLADYPLHLVDGVQMYTNFSFPSGHSTSIFTLCMCLATLSSSLLMKIVLFCIAVIVAFSRMYLSQHFLVDIYAGSIIGTFSAIIVFYFISKQKALWLDKSLPVFIKKKVKE